MPNTVIVSAINEYRPDGSYWFTTTVNGAAFPFAWRKPLDNVPGGQAVAQACSDRYNRLVTPITTYLVGQTITVPNIVFPSTVYTVVFSGTAASVYSIISAATVQLNATVNAASTQIVMTIDELIELFGANQPVAVLNVATRFAKAYADSLRWGAQYVGTFTTN